MRVLDPTVADASGQILNASQGAGRGFVLIPTAVGPDSSALAVKYDSTVLPGCFPVELRTKSGRVIHVPNSAEFFSDFDGFDLLGMQPGDSWQVIVLEDDHERVRVQGGKVQSARTLAKAGTALPTTAPTGPTDGWPLRTGFIALDFYFGATFAAGETVTPYVMTAAGDWEPDAGNVMKPADDGLVQGRITWLRGRRFSLVSSAAARTVEIDVELEVG